MGLTQLLLIWFFLNKPKAQTNSPLAVKACVPYLYAMLLGNFDRVKITNLGKSFYIQCYSCQLTNSVEPNLDKDSAIMILLKRPGYVLLPVELGNDPWFENSGLQALKRLNELIRPKRFVETLIFRNNCFNCHINLYNIYHSLSTATTYCSLC